MAHYWTCPHCGANLDPGEICDCQNENAAPGEATTQDGNVEQIGKPVPSHYTKESEVVNND